MRESFLILFGQISVGALKLENKTVQSRGLPAAICLSLGKLARFSTVVNKTMNKSHCLNDH